SHRTRARTEPARRVYHHRAMTMARVYTMLIAQLAILLMAARAPGDEGVEKQVRRLNRRAMAAYDALDFDSAKKTLLDAVALLRSNGLDATPQAARTYLNLGIVYVAGLKDQERGLEQFATALRLDPNLKLDPELASPELEQAFQSAEAEMAARRSRPAPPPET